MADASDVVRVIGDYGDVVTAAVLDLEPTVWDLVEAHLWVSSNGSEQCDEPSSTAIKVITLIRLAMDAETEVIELIERSLS